VGSSLPYGTSPALKTRKILLYLHSYLPVKKGQIAQLVEQRTENPSPYSNISDLAPKTMQTNTDKALECRQNADK